MEAYRNDQCLAVGCNGPGQLVRTEIRGHLHGEQAPLAAGQKMGRLALIGTTRLNAIVWSDREINFLFRIAVEIAEQQAEAPIRVLEPTFKRTGDARAGFVHRFERQRLRLNQHGEKKDGAQEAQRAHGPLCLLCFLCSVFPLHVHYCAAVAATGRLSCFAAQAL